MKCTQDHHSRVITQHQEPLAMTSTAESKCVFKSHADVDVVFVCDEGRLVVADVAVKSFNIRLVAVYAPNISVERASFFRRLAPFLDDTKRLALMGDWNAILDPKIDKSGGELEGWEGVKADLLPSWLVMVWSTGSDWITQGGRCGRGLIAHPLPKWVPTWTEYWLEELIATSLVVTRSTDHKLVSVSLRLANRPCLAGYWKFNPSLLEIQDFLEPLESMIKRVLVGAVTGNRWWVSSHRIRDFATKYGRQLNLDRTKEAKSIEDQLSLSIELARGDLERKTSERYKGFVARSRLKRVLNEAVKSNATAHEEEVRRFPDRYIDSVKSPDGHLLRSNR